MQITTEWMLLNFRQLDKEYFGGQLPMPKFSVCNARTRLGALLFKWRAVRTGIFAHSVKRQCYDYEIRISNYYDIGERQFQEILLHEMIHYYIAVNNLRDTSSHGPTFRRIMAQLNARGWHISIRTDTRGWAPAKRNAGKQRVLLAGITTDGRYFLSIISPGSVRSVDRQARLSPQVRQHAWYTTTDSYFQNFSLCRTLRGRTVPAEVFFEKTSPPSATALPAL